MAGGECASMCAAIEANLRGGGGWRLTSPSSSRTTKSRILPPTTSGPSPSLDDEEFLETAWRGERSLASSTAISAPFFALFLTNARLALQISWINFYKVEPHGLPGSNLRLSPCVSSLSRDRMKGVISRPVTPLEIFIKARKLIYYTQRKHKKFN